MSDFVLALHTHLPYVLHHGRWPHGSDWICEAAIDSYLPLLGELRRLEAEGVPAPITIGFTPVLANQLASPAFPRELEDFFAQRLHACAEAPASLQATGDAHLIPLAEFWRDRLERLRSLFHQAGSDLVAAFRTLESNGRIEIISSAATHGYLPLLARDESIRLQLAVARIEHRRLFGRTPSGLWLPECAYRPRGPWPPGDPNGTWRRGLETYVAEAGFRYFFTDSHMARAGSPLGLYDLNLEIKEEVAVPPAERSDRLERSPYRAYRVHRSRHTRPVAVMARDPRSSLQVWSRHQGYPGDEQYLEFHKIRFPGGLKYWRVTGGNVDLGGKLPYFPAAAHDKLRGHAAHFTSLLGSISVSQGTRPVDVIVAPFDTELFGHWWFEGPEFIGEVYRRLAHQTVVHPATASRHLQEHPPRFAMRLTGGSWGKDGDDSMWMSDKTYWMWQRLWPLEHAFWDAVPKALGDSRLHFLIEQAARELLLAQSSDWPFIISTGAVADYGTKRFVEHAADAEALILAIRPEASESQREQARNRAAELRQRDDVFPDILRAVAAAATGESLTHLE